MVDRLAEAELTGGGWLSEGPRTRIELEAAAEWGGLPVDPGVLSDAVRRVASGKTLGKNIRLRGFMVTGSLDLSGVQLPGELALDSCLILGDISMGDATVHGLRITRSAIEGFLDISGTRIAAALLLDETTVAHSLNGYGTTIGDRIGCVELRVHGAGDPAINFDGARVAGQVDAARLEAAGEVRMRMREVGGGMTFTDARLGGHPTALQLTNVNIDGALRLNSSRPYGDFLASGAVHLDGTHVNGQLNCTGATFGAEGVRHFEVLTARNLAVRDAFFLNHGTARGAIALTAATIGGQFNASGEKFHSNLDANRLTVGSDLWLNDGLEMQGRAILESATVGGRVIATDGRFAGDLAFDDATIDGECMIRGAFPQGRLHFRRARFGGYADFDRTTFPEAVGFEESRFLADASFTDCVFEDGFDFDGVVFAGRALFNQARVHGNASFERALFDGDAVFDDVLVTATTDTDEGSRITFASARFARARSIGAITADLAVLDDAMFVEPVSLALAVSRLSARRAQFRGGATIDTSGNVDLWGAGFGAPSVLARLAEDEAEPVRGAREPTLPAILSLENADVGDLLISSFDLTHTRLAGAHRLDRMRIGSGCQLDHPPETQRWRWSQRQILAEERMWRAQQNFRSWSAQGTTSQSAADIAANYRGLRKAREDAKDYAGAADFYWGEMEMRRHGRRYARARGPGRAEAWLVSVYWAVSGYGLRASRALLTLSLAIVMAAVVADDSGFAKPQSFGHALVWATGSAIAFGASPDYPLTTTGDVLRVALRILGPILLGLAALALRGRLRR